MDESEWWGCVRPRLMLEWLQTSGKLSRRKAGLVSVALCRRVWALLNDTRSRVVVEVVERYMDEMASYEELAVAYEAAAQAAQEWGAWGAFAASAAAATAKRRGGDPKAVAENTALAVASHAQWTVGAAFNATLDVERSGQAAIIREILGPLPFRSIAIDLSWRTSPVTALATTNYEERRWEAMAVLADALEEAGCNEPEILGHLREKGQVHVRGCWCLDLVLAKE